MKIFAARKPVNTPAERSPTLPSTGTIDDQDEPEDERDEENEIPLIAPSDDTEAPEEFEGNNDVREPHEREETPA
jgi:hypothetical protein